jgi:hypothetical protein
MAVDFTLYTRGKNGKKKEYRSEIQTQKEKAKYITNKTEIRRIITLMD